MAARGAVVRFGGEAKERRKEGTEATASRAAAPRGTGRLSAFLFGSWDFEEARGLRAYVVPRVYDGWDRG